MRKATAGANIVRSKIFSWLRVLWLRAVNARQRVVAVLVAVNVGQRHIIMNLLQQPEPFPGKPGGDRFTGWLARQGLTTGHIA